MGNFSQAEFSLEASSLQNTKNRENIYEDFIGKADFPVPAAISILQNYYISLVNICNP